MITGKIMDGYSTIDGCFKYSDSDYTIDCYVLQRDKISKALRLNDKEFRTNSVYLLVGEQDDNTMAYIGKSYGSEARSNLERHVQHNNSYTEKYADYWSTAIIFVCNNTNPDEMWTTATIDDLEALLIQDINSQFCWNGREEKIKNTLGQEHIRSYANKLRIIKEYIKELGLTFFNKLDIKESEISEENIIKDIIDNTVELNIINLEKDSRVPEYTTPEKVVNQMLDILPWDEFDHTTTFFDPACKGGEFLALIHDRLLKILEKDTYFDKYKDNEKYVRIHDHIINNMLYGMAIGENSYNTSKERVYNCRHIIKANDQYIKLLKCNSTSIAEELTKTFLGEKEMKFDVVIGNPPYQDEKNSIYHKFIEFGCDIADMVCLITRNNWFNGKAFKNTREKVFNNGGIIKINDYPLIGDLFKGVKVAVASFLYRTNYYGKTHYTRIENGRVILEQDLNIDANNFIIYKSDISKSIINKLELKDKWTDIYNTRSYPFMDQRKYNDLDIRNNKTEKYNVAVMNTDGDTIYTTLDSFRNTNEVLQYKVVCGVIINEAFENKSGNVLTNIQALGPYTVSSHSWSLISTFNDKDEAINCKKYINTKFVKFLCNQTVNNRSTVTDNTFQFVPLQDFTSNSDIDWTKSISEIDRQLYVKYKLNQKEIEYIEKTIKSMDNTSKHQSSLTNQVVQANYINKIASGLVPNTI